MKLFTATLITRNEEQNLPRALESLRLADEIVVVDSGSTDRTVEVARQHGARVVVHPLTNFAEQKNFAAAQATHDWILNLDADEVISPELADELRAWKERPPEAVAYRMPRKANYLGSWIRHSGWYPDPKVRLYRRDRARFVGALHESVQVDGTVGELRGEILHYTCDSLADHVAKVNYFTTLAARELHAQSPNSGRGWLVSLLFAPPLTFLRTYLFQQGFRDGYRGLLIAGMAGFYTFLKYAKLGVLASGGTLDASTPARRGPSSLARDGERKTNREQQSNHRPHA